MVKLLRDICKDVPISTLMYSYFPHMFLDLSFQRLSSWTVTQQQKYFINLLRGRAKSPITVGDVLSCEQSMQTDADRQYFTDVKAMKGHYVSVDGNNGKIAIEDYMNNKYPISGTFADQHGQIFIIKEQRFDELDDVTKNFIKNTQVRVSEFVNASYDDLRETFEAINDGLPLNPAEKRNAIGTRQASHVRDLASKFKDVVIDWFGEQSYKRRGGDNFIAFCLEFEETNFRTGVTSQSVTKFYREEDVKNKIFEQHERNINILFGVMENTEVPKDFSVSWAISLYMHISKLASKGIVVNKNKLNIFGNIFWQEDKARRMHDKKNTHGYHELCRRTTTGVEDLEDAHRHDMRYAFIQKDFDKNKEILFKQKVIIKQDKRRTFSEEQREELWKIQNGTCPVTDKKIPILEINDSKKWQADHYPDKWIDGGETEVYNGRLICAKANMSDNKPKVNVVNKINEDNTTSQNKNKKEFETKVNV